MRRTFIRLWLPCAVVAFLWTATVPAGAVTIDMVTVGNPGNANDPATGSVYGRVDYSYQIGKYDVTIAQYTAFLNAADPTGTNPNGIYKGQMDTDRNNAGISFDAGALSGSKYAAIGPFGITNGQSAGNRPIAYVSWYDAARFANWMTNGQGSGSTETGAYDFANAPAGMAPAKTPGAAFYIPTENEWYKAAYFSPNYGGVGIPGYYMYATQSDTAPGNTIGGNANQANYLVNVSDPDQNYLTDVGAFTNSASYYGTFDQSGNLYQWNDLDGASGSTRGYRGGRYGNYEAGPLSSSQRGEDPSFWYGNYYTGFRLASPLSAPSVPEIDPNSLGSVLALVLGSLGLLERRRLKAA
jgi:formylglycine-generating enzyme required for sulfatase activity